MKKIITSLLILAMIVCMIPAFAVSAEEAGSAIPDQTDVSTADELLDYIRLANEETAKSENATAGKTLSIVDDIDLSGKTWEPLTRWLGTLEGNEHTLSGINYATDAAEENVGIVAKLVANNDNIKGAIYDLILKDCTISAPNANKVGGIVGMTDRGRIEYCTVDNVTVNGGKIVGGIAGRTSYASDNIAGDPALLLTNNAAKNCTVKGTEMVGALIGLIRSDDVIYDISGWEVENTTIDAPDGALTGKDYGNVYGAAQKCYVQDDHFFRQFEDDGALLNEISLDDEENGDNDGGAQTPTVTTGPAVTVTPTTTAPDTTAPTDEPSTTTAPDVTAGTSDGDSASDGDGSVLPIVLVCVVIVVALAVVVVVIKKKNH